MNGVSTNKYCPFLIIYFRNINAALKKYGTQHALLLMIEKWRKSLDNGDIFGAVLTDLSKAFDCLPHDLINS